MRLVFGGEQLFVLPLHGDWVTKMKPFGIS